MCECGCTMNDDLYTLPGPGKTFYVLRLHGGCVDCDSPPGVTVEHFKPGDFSHGYYSDPEATDGPLPLEKWGTDGRGVAIVCGMRRREFVRQTQSHLIGVSGDEMGEKGRIDAGGAEVILEEMYGDAMTKPRVVKPGGAA